MRFRVGDLVVMDRGVARFRINHGGYGDYILKVGVVVETREHFEREIIVVKFPSAEPPQEWPGSHFEWIGTDK